MRVPRDVQEAVASVTGQRPAEVTVRRGPLVNRTAARMAADSYATEGIVHLPGSAPLTTDHSRRLLAHELTHVVQQTSGTAPHHEATPAGRMAEQQAMRVEAAFAAPRTPAASTASPSVDPSPTTLGPTVMGSAVMGSAVMGHAAATLNGRPAVPRSTSAAAADRTGTLPRTTAQRMTRRSSAPLAATPLTSTSPSGASLTGDDGRGRWSGSASPPPAGLPSTPALRDAVPRTPADGRPPAIPVPTVTHQAPAPPASLPSPTAPGSAPTQRRAANRSEPPGHRGDGGRPSSHTPAPTPAPPAGSARTPLPEPAIDTATDDTWLQRHAYALYPHLRQMLRNEFLLDRERRGRLMRDD